ncbi:hypothetical protein C900_00213 [Fulvivirga imtechensis AK7]|uniref:YD repeat protein n=1 Tax=Fulvivirga imtechensis AK7 TaxID=1237149 RepID=L8JIF5_9BACT|nr:hypothetical protein [Fulvivirga imtechensis]ELR68610.1 hypothetical protein C900_00213 [Fulvivirga imtechensis AK7]
MYKLYLITTLMIHTFFITSAQEDDIQSAVSVIPPAPNVAAFQKFTDIPVSHYTGIPQISIPIYKIKMNQFELPITLDYHSSGIKVEEYSSWVGYGWSLSAGGAISRTVNGLPDEYSGGADKGFFHNRRLYNENGTVNSSLLSCSNSAGVPFNDANWSTADSLSMGILTAEPDVYYLRAPSVNNKFVFNINRQILKYEVDDIKILYHPYISFPELSPTDYTWKIKGTDGTNYTFDIADRTYTKSSCGDSYPSSISEYQSSWHLTEMSNGNEWIKFKYVTEVIDYEMRLVSTGRFRLAGNTNSAGYKLQQCRNSTTTNSKRLSNITTSNGYKIEFVANKLRSDLNGSNALEEVIIYYNNKLIKRFKIETSYFSGNKLKLKSIYEVSTKDSRVKLNDGYRCEYYSGNVPPVYSNAQDSWGYYNAATSNTHLIPQYKDNFWNVNNHNPANRTPSLECKNGTLSQLYYPTGGYSEFKYELNDYFDTNFSQTYFYKANALGETENIDTDEVTFSVLEDCYSTIKKDDNPQAIDHNSNILRWNGSNYQPVTLATNNSRWILPAGQYKLNAVSGDGIESFVSIEFEQIESKNVYVGGLRIQEIIFYDPVNISKEITRFEYRRDFNNSESSGVLFTKPIFAYQSKYRYGDVQDFICYDTQSESVLNMESHSQLPLTTVQGSHVGYSKVQEYKIKTEDHGLSTYPESLRKQGMIEYQFVNDEPTNDVAYPYIPQEDLSYKNGKLIRKTIYEQDTDLLNLVKVKETVNEYKFISSSERVIGFKLRRKQSYYCYHCSYNDDFARHDYEIRPMWYYLHKSEEKKFQNETVVYNFTVDYDYMSSPQIHHYYTSKTIRNSNGDVLSQKIDRDEDNPHLVIRVEQKVNGNLVKGRKQTYHYKLPLSRFIYNADLNEYSEEMLYSYNGDYLISQLNVTTGTRTSYIYWSLNDTSKLLSAEVVKAEPGEIYYTGFESSGSTGFAKTGDRYHIGNSYAIPISERPTGDDLVMTYWYLNNGSWYFQDEISYNPVITLPANASGLDELRVYPQGAKMTTYNYNANFDISCISDPNNLVQYYIYDDFHRLIYVKDHDHNILKAYTYSYARH